MEQSSEHESSFEEQVILANTLSHATNERNSFIERQGGFDAFAEAGQYISDTRSVYDGLEDAVAAARKEFDEKVSDKKEFVRQLRDTGDDALADLITMMFSVGDK